MLKLILNDLIDSSIPIKISDYEIETKRYWPNYEFHFCLGTDLINGVSKWTNGEKLKEEFNFIICNRLNYIPIESNYPKNFRVLEEFIDASSTRIRDRINENLFSNCNNKLNLGINGLTTQSVINYIIKHELYSIALASKSLG